MKKLMMAVFAAAMLVAFAAPAFAFDVEFGGRVRTDFGYNYTSEEATQNGTDSTIRGFLSVASSSYFRATFTSKDKKVGVRIEMGLGGTMTRRPVFGWYSIGNCKLIAGNNYTWAGDGVIGTASWLTDPTTNGVGLNYFGRMPMIALEWRDGNYGVQIGIFEPMADSVSNAADFGWYLPQLHVTGDLKFAMFQLAPAFAIVNYQWEQLAVQTGDSSYTAWYVGLPVKGTFGPVTVMGNLFYAVNGADDFGQHPMAAPVLVGAGRVEDATSYGGLVEVSYSAGPLKLTGGFGGVYVENDGWTEMGYSDDSFTQIKAFVTMDYKLHANLTLRPEIGYYDMGDDPETGNDSGNKWMFGLRFQFVF